MSSLDFSHTSKTDRALFEKRMSAHFAVLFPLLIDVYGHRYDFYYHLQELTQTLLNGLSSRSRALKKRDGERLAEPQWFRQENMLGMACYVDLFAGNLTHLQSRIPYLKDLGVTYLHLMPLYAAPEGDSDGGYAVSDYRTVDRRLGTMRDLSALAEALRNEGISLVLDFVFNHTSDEHPWALAAQQGDSQYQDYYYLFDDRRIPDEYEKNLREIFPQVRRGNFTWNENTQKWVWTTFNSFQWDLNYSNPEVFTAIVGEMLFLANIGCDALRLDALAFIWKEMGTDCENQHKAHVLIKAFNACLQIAAPAVVFKSEAIVHPDEVNKYIAKDECQLSYNPLLMALIWNSLATRKTRLLTHSMQKSFRITDDCAWVNYVRCHDDIGWTFDDAVAWDLGINPQDHRHFLNQFFTGRFDGSFASGVAFAENPSTGDCRVCGSLASLCGVELALMEHDDAALTTAIKRVLLVHSIILSIGGIPLLYSGDELGLLNDYGYRNDPAKTHDDRWVQRIPIDDDAIQQLTTQGDYHQIIYDGIKRMVAIRKSHAVFGSSQTRILRVDNEHCFAFRRYAASAKSAEQLTVIVNFSEHAQTVNIAEGQLCGVDLLSHPTETVKPHKTIAMAPYQTRWILH
ncbi:amylosucrase [Alteromonas oceanisediminis]|uniref:amylosucrase n=1 Tax=Alteromonas oceanisediminis TaxID=2836180 RepID=UPI001BDA5BB5|nr:amylosucrase [Alteromonas oceanisediminis]MBT0586974.1 alpha-amylase family protein [Alteromonas oceanisediminis]